MAARTTYNVKLHACMLEVRGRYILCNFLVIDVGIVYVGVGNVCGRG